MNNKSNTPPSSRVKTIASTAFGELDKYYHLKSHNPHYVNYTSPLDFILWRSLDILVKIFTKKRSKAHHQVM